MAPTDVCNYKHKRGKMMFVFLIYLFSILPQVPNFLGHLSQSELSLKHVCFAALTRPVTLNV